MLNSSGKTRRQRIVVKRKLCVEYIFDFQPNNTSCADMFLSWFRLIFYWYTHLFYAYLFYLFCLFLPNHHLCHLKPNPNQKSRKQGFVIARSLQLVLNIIKNYLCKLRTTKVLENTLGKCYCQYLSSQNAARLVIYSFLNFKKPFKAYKPFSVMLLWSNFSLTH